MRYFLLCLILFFIQEVCGQSVTLSREQALADIDTLVSRIVYTHPNPFTVCPETVFRERIARIKAEFPDTLTDLEFGRRVIPAVAMLGDGHTQLSLPNPTSEQLFFPQEVRIHWQDSSLTLEDNHSKIIRINDRSVKEVLGDMVQYVGGERMHFRFSCVQTMFDFLLNAFYPDSVYRLVVQQFDGKQIEKIVRAVPLGELKKQRQAERKKEGKKKADYAFQLSEDGKSMFFEFRHFYDPDRFKIFADSMFREIRERKIKNLVIDIRQNGGGNSGIGDELLQYLLHTHFAQFEKVQAHVGRYTNHIEYEREEFKNFTDSVVSISVPLTFLRKEPLRITKKTKVYLLTSNYTFSSAAAFSWAFQYFKGGIVIGEETGGMNVTFGDLRDYTLPHSHLQGVVSWKRFYQYGADDRNIHGTLPDVEVPADQALEYTVKHFIQKKKK